jgi:hypothetical protein
MTKMGGIKKKNNTLSGVFLGEFALFDLSSCGYYFAAQKVFLPTPSSDFSEEGGKAFLEFKAGFCFCCAKIGLP